MKAALFAPERYTGNTAQDKWPVPVDSYQSEVAEKTMEWSLERVTSGSRV